MTTVPLPIRPPAGSPTAPGTVVVPRWHRATESTTPALGARGVA